MGSRAGSSRPAPRPVVPIMTPFKWGRDLRRVVSAVMAVGKAERGSVPKA